MTLLLIGREPERAPLPRLTRRRLMQIGLASAYVACAPQTKEQAKLAVENGIAVWPHDISVPTVSHPGYGMFPDYLEIGDTGPWPKILSDRHKRQIEKFADLILPATDTAPAPSTVGIADFFDDWTSAPYPWMSDTRRIVHQGFAWLDAQMDHDHGTDWLGATEDQARAQLDRMRDASPDEGHLTQQANMYVQLCQLIIGAYYTTPEGEADLGHVSAVPLAGDYPGPTGDALTHIQGLIAAQGLDWDDLPVGPPPYDVKPYRFTADEPS